jgi:hypothetical protein
VQKKGLCIVLVKAAPCAAFRAFEEIQTRAEHIEGHKFAPRTQSTLSICVNCCAITTFFQKLVARLLAVDVSEQAFSVGKKQVHVIPKETKCFLQ